LCLIKAWRQLNIGQLPQYIAGQVGETLLKGEFEGMRAIEAFAPDIVPHVIATGQTTSLPKLLFPDPKHPVPIAFYVTEFLNLTPVMDLPPSRLVVEALGALQATSMTHPSNPGTFGFHMNTYNGRRLQPISPPRATWSELWATYMMNLYDQSAAANANDEWPEFATLMKRVCSHLVPRMLGPDILREPASRGGGPLRPALLHGDLWDGNVALNTDTGGLVMFDCSAMWGHQELDIVLLACPMREYSSTPILEEYLSVMEPSEPKDEFQDRRRLYNLKEFIGRTILYPGHISRQL
jgi:protein-ribulosamine 3-kinase